MSISYRYDPETKIVYSTLEGEINTEEFLAYLHEVIADEQIAPGFIEVVDFAAVKTFVTNYQALRTFPGIWGEYKRKGCEATIAYAPTDLGYGICRMAQSVLEVSQNFNLINFIIVRAQDDIDLKIQAIQNDTS